MNKICTICLFLVLSVALVAQVPESMNYQAVIRDAEGALVKNSVINLKVSILKGLTNNSTVYFESHSVRSNSNGLITIEIGKGTSANKFSDIEWSKDSHFIKVEADVNNNNNYSVIGTSQLLSVPYALHAKTADTVLNGGSQGTDTISARYVGELYGGGVIAWLDRAGAHGLIVSLENLSSAQPWSNVLTTAIGEPAQSRVAGNENSTAIISQGGHMESAAQLCLNYSNADKGTGTFSDWYLPGIDEMKKIWQNLYEIETCRQNQLNKVAIDPFLYEYYWTSTEYSQFSAWGYNFYNGHPYSSNKYTNGYVRAVRKF